MAIGLLNNKTVESNEDNSSSGFVERLLSSKLAPYVVAAFFLAALLIWSDLDHALPMHDAAWHSSYSSTFKSWLTHPKSWSLATFVPLLKMHFGYPVGVWFSNGVLKLGLGDSLWSEHAILAIYLAVLNASTWSLVHSLFKDRLKATLSIIFLNACPLILALQHVSFLDLPSTAFFALFMANFVSWWQNQTWKKSIIAALLFGLCCLSKQIALFYCMPCMVIYGLILLYRKNWKGLFQICCIAATGGLFLLSWVIPNLQAIQTYSHLRTNSAAETVGFVGGVIRNIQMGSVQIVQSFSPIMSLMLLLGLKFIRKDDWKAVWPIVVSPLGGALLMITYAFYNLPEPRYFCVLMLPAAILLAAALANVCRKSRLGVFATVASIVLTVMQALILCFQVCPVVPSEAVTNPSNAYKFFGITDGFLRLKLPYYAAGDPWRQEWVYQFIEDTERGRLVYLNVLANSIEYNQGTLACLSRMRKSCINPTTWRTCMPDQTDSFNCTDQELNRMEWLLLQRNGNSTRWHDEQSKKKFDQIVDTLAHSGKFVEAARQTLPDKSELILYRNKFWIFLRPEEIARAKLKITESATAAKK